MDKLSLGKAYVQIIPSADGISGKIKDELAGGASEAGDHAGTTIASRIKGAIIKAGIGTALVGIFKSAIDEGSKLEQSIGGIETLFKGSAGQMEKYAKEAFRTAGLSANDFMEQATSFSAGLIKSTGGDTKKAADIANMAMIDMSDNMNKMGSSMESIQFAYQGFARQNYTMLDNLKLGYGGTKDEMHRLLSDAQKLTGVKYDINNLSDVFSAIHVIQKELGITGTTAKEAQSTFSGSFNQMKASVQNLLGYLATGMDVGPAIDDLVSSAGTFLFDNFLPMVGRIALALPGTIIKGLKTGIPRFIEFGKQFIQAIGKGMAEEFPKLAGLFENLLPILQTIGVVLASWKAVQLFRSMSTTIQTLLKPLSSMLLFVTNMGGPLNVLKAAFSALVSPIGLVVAAVAALAGAFITLWNTNKEFRDNVISIWNSIVAKFQEFFQGIVDRLNALGFDFKNITDVMSTIWKSFCDLLVPVFEGVFSQIETILSSVLDALTGILDIFIGVFTGNWDQAWNGVKELFGAVWDFICGTFKNATNILMGVLDWFCGLFGTTWENVWNGISSFFSNIWNNIKSFFTNIGNGILGTARNIFNGIKSAIENPMETAKNFVRGIIEKIRGFFNFSVSWPHIPLPHFSISPAGWNVGDLLKGKIPSLGINWYAKAMDSGMILNGATIFGHDGKQFLGGGEAGPEAVVGVNSLMSMIKNAVATVDSNMGSVDWDYDQLTKAVVAAIETLKLETNVMIDGRMIQKIIGQVCARDDRSYVVARGG